MDTNASRTPRIGPIMLTKDRSEFQMHGALLLPVGAPCLLCSKVTLQRLCWDWLDGQPAQLHIHMQIVLRH